MTESGKTRPPRATTPVEDDASIPVLTERLTLPPLELDFTLPPAPTVTGTPTEAPPTVAPEAPAPVASTPTVAAPPPAEVPWGRVEIELREAILRDLAERLPTDVEGIVRRQMSVAIDAAVQRLASEARLALASSLREIVDRAVRAELERLRGLKE
ncbi:MAG: hypothetical protein L6Q72_05065 [Burkholderiaceae bacterium]|nr:hypothetical protein [Burkholderiaceae bacterium]